MRGHLPASRAAKRQRRRPENEPRHCRACRRAAHCSAKPASASSKQASASCAPCLHSSAPDAASLSRLANMPSRRSTPRRPAKTAQPPPVIPAPSHKARLGNMYWAALSHGAHRLTPTGLFLLVGGFKNWFGFLEQRVAIQRGLPGTRRQPLPPNPAPPAPTERCSTRPTSRHRPRPIHCRAPPAPRPARRP